VKSHFEPTFLPLSQTILPCRRGPCVGQVETEEKTFIQTVYQRITQAIPNNRFEYVQSLVNCTQKSVVENYYSTVEASGTDIFLSHPFRFKGVAIRGDKEVVDPLNFLPCLVVKYFEREPNTVAHLESKYLPPRKYLPPSYFWLVAPLFACCSHYWLIGHTFALRHGRGPISCSVFSPHVRARRDAGTNEFVAVRAGISEIIKSMP